MTEKIKLSYFPLKALAEPIRFLLAYSGKDFEDNRIPREDWPNIKPTTPWGKVPVLEINGERVTQFLPITRYLAREAGLTGKDAWEDLRIEEIVYVIEEFRTELAKYHYEEDKTRKEAVKGPLFKDLVPYYLKKLNAHVKENNGYLANGKFSWADVYFAAIVDYLSFMKGSDLTAEYPDLKAIQEKVNAQPKIKEYISKRPSTPD